MATLTRRAVTRALAGIVPALLAVASFSLVAPPSATADTQPPIAGTPVTASADSLPTAQINGVVWDQVIVGDTVYAGGDFTSARPAGAPAGSGEVARSYLLSYRLSTGELTGWAPTLDAQVRALAASPDGTRVYAVGEFTSVNGSVRNRIVAFDTATGNVATAFAASSNAALYAVAASNASVYVAGNITAASGVSRPGTAAAFSAATGTPTAWAPTLAGGRAYSMVVSPDDAKVVIAGNFTTVNGSGNPGYGIAAVDTSTGALVPFAIASTVRNAGEQAAIYNLDSDASSVYGTGYTFGGGGNLEGAWKASWSDGTLQWINNCIGDEYSIAAGAGAVYIAGHPHTCSIMGDFPQTTPWTWHRALALSPSATQTLPSGNFAGKPGPSVLNFYPNINQGTFTGQAQGPWSVAANQNYVVYAGEFTEVNGKPQQGLSRFAVPSIAPNREGPVLSGADWTPGGSAMGAGTIAVNWPANWDRDNELLTYRVLRDGVVIQTQTATSRFWDRPTLNFVDSGLVPGSSHDYRIQAVDPWGNAASSATVTVLAGTAGNTSAYAKAVLADQPGYYYRLDGTSGTEANLAGSTANTTQAANVQQQLPLTVGSSAVRGSDGAIANEANTSIRFTNSSASRAYQTQQTWSDDSLSVEAWFKTTTASGKIVGFGSSTTASNSSSYDRSLYLNGGRVTWGVYDTAQRTLQSAASNYNDGKWHQVVGSLSSTGMSLYVDGQLVGSRADVVFGGRYWGAWRIGGDSTWAGNQNFTGNIDEVAVYSAPLSAQKVAQHFQLGTGAAVVNVPPTARMTATTSFLTARVDGTTSSDSDGSIVSYAWDFGDGTTGSGATATRVYQASGTYTVRLTVTDDAGATATTQQAVTVTNQPPAPPGSTIAKDSFERTVATGWGTATTGGAWTTASGSSYGVSGGAGSASHTAGSTRRGSLTGVSQLDTVSDVKISLDKNAAGGSAFAGAVARQVGTEYYQGRLRYNTDGSVGLQLMRGASTTLANLTSTGVTATPGRQLQLKVAATGSSPTTLAAKVWPVGSPEPSAWQLTASDSTTALQTPGYVGLESYLSGAATNAHLTVAYDDYLVTAPAAPNQPPVAAFRSTTAGLTATLDASASQDPDGRIVAYSWDFGDGTSGNGASSTHNYGAAGTYTVTLTVTDDSGATATTSSSVTVARPPNQSPVASFTASAVDNVVSFDGTASTDPDGAVVSYAWSFGDGDTGAGANATHAYAAAGSYTATLTVTDDQGATATAARTVVAGAPPAPVTTLASDAFARTTTTGWGTADVGGAWNATASTNYVVNSGSAAAVHTAGSTRHAILPGTSSTRSDSVVTVSVDKAATGGGVYAGVVGRQVGSSFYLARIRFNPDGSVGLQLLSGSVVLQSATVAGLVYQPGQQLRIRMLTTGTAPTTLSARVWAAGASEPTTWQATATDATAALQAAGSVGLESYVSGSATNAPVTVRYDDLLVTSP